MTNLRHFPYVQRALGRSYLFKLFIQYILKLKKAVISKFSITFNLLNKDLLNVLLQCLSSFDVGKSSFFGAL